MLLGQNVRNSFINADFTIAQRSPTVSLNVSSAFVVDRWTWRTDAGGGTLATGTISRQAINTSHPFFLEQTHFVRIQNTSQGTSLGTNSYAFLAQYIEGVQRHSGKRITVSIWAESTIANKVLNVNFSQNFGSGGSATVVSGKQIVLTGNTTLTRYDVTLDIPSVNGKIIGAGSYLAIYMEFQSGTARSALAGIGSPVAWQANGNIDIYRMQVNDGPACDFQLAGMGNAALEKYLCFRFYENNYPTNVYPGEATGAGELTITLPNNVANGANARAMLLFRATKRIIPIVKYYPGGGLTGSNAVYVQGASRSVSVGNIGDNSVGSMTNTSGVQWNTGETVAFFFDADAEF